MTKQMLEETSDTFAALDSHNRDIGNYELLLSNSSPRNSQLSSITPASRSSTHRVAKFQHANLDSFARRAI